LAHIKRRGLWEKDRVFQTKNLTKIESLWPISKNQHNKNGMRSWQADKATKKTALLGAVLFVGGTRVVLFF
jgi:hypothetical protein